MEVAYRPARREDAADLAILADMAGHGLPQWFWHGAREREGFSSVVEVGRNRVRSDDHAMSWRKMHVATVNGEIAGMILDYPLTDKNSDTDIAECGPVIASLLLLENDLAPCWYINMLAVYRDFRGQGIGGQLIEGARERALEAGYKRLGLGVEDDNPAVSLYRRCGFEKVGQQNYEPFGGVKEAGHWYAMHAESKPAS
ncbi:GNAT family N-acetyltransferase [Notoacmeibacter sp. MSK16QG-6]|uniref:GNAT family N-acetyltransferase n=1 Tax=Notoacmeibacter sp. MSK16QG-6 TaxID=2957982 RepID=UPI0020A059F3|nr:GNAT family N-acetyltransferase [Notoacmeibacter sp. MSK16QG-6]MCP1200768.1 GNAT family N-acetyltransferase [Notoacmeibacter sp. MSK16QG-6]